jgi:hypothetical protein
MASSQAFIEYLQEQLTGCGAGEIYCRKMFGEYGLYCDGVFFGLVCDDQFFVKITEAGKAILGEKYPTGLAYGGAKTPMFKIDDFEDYDVMHQLIQATCAELMKKGKGKK